MKSKTVSDDVFRAFLARAQIHERTIARATTTRPADAAVALAQFVVVSRNTIPPGTPPTDIFTADETPGATQGRQGKAGTAMFAVGDERGVVALEDQGKRKFSILAVHSASGDKVPSFLLIAGKGQKVNKRAISGGEVDGVVPIFSKRGLTDGESLTEIFGILRDWHTQRYGASAKRRRLYLVWDGCPSHSARAVQGAVDKFGITLVWLPPNTTLFAQYADLYWFGPFWASYRAFFNVHRARCQSLSAQGERVLWGTLARICTREVAARTTPERQAQRFRELGIGPLRDGERLKFRSVPQLEGFDEAKVQRLRGKVIRRHERTKEWLVKPEDIRLPSGACTTAAMPPAAKVHKRQPRKRQRGLAGTKVGKALAALHAQSSASDGTDADVEADAGAIAGGGAGGDADDHSAPDALLGGGSAAGDAGDLSALDVLVEPNGAEPDLGDEGTAARLKEFDDALTGLLADPNNRRKKIVRKPRASAAEAAEEEEVSSAMSPASPSSSVAESTPTTDAHDSDSTAAERPAASAAAIAIRAERSGLQGGRGGRGGVGRGGGGRGLRRALDSDFDCDSDSSAVAAAATSHRAGGRGLQGRHGGGRGRGRGRGRGGGRGSVRAHDSESDTETERPTAAAAATSNRAGGRGLQGGRGWGRGGRGRGRGAMKRPRSSSGSGSSSSA